MPITLASAVGWRFSRRRDAGTDWQLIEVTDEDGCANGGVFSSASVDVQLLIDQAFSGVHHALTEALLELASVALGKTGAGQCNDGFLRPGAELVILVASDEREQSGVPAAAWLFGSAIAGLAGLRRRRG